MEAQEQFTDIITTLAGVIFVFIIVFILLIDIRNIIISKRINAKVIRIVESPSSDEDGHQRIGKHPEIEFIDPNGKTVIHQLAFTNSTWRKPGDKIKIYYRQTKNALGYKISAPFMWPKIILLLFLTLCASLLLFGPPT